MQRTREMNRQELPERERQQEMGSQVSQGSKSPAHVALSHQNSLAKYKFKDKIIVRKVKTANTEHYTPSRESCGVWGPVRLHWPHAHEIDCTFKRERVLPWASVKDMGK